MDNVSSCLFCILVMLTTLTGIMLRPCSAEEGVITGFEIKAFQISGNTLFPAGKLEETVAPFTGPWKTAADVEKARDALEKLYHDAGYPAVMVNIPEQTLKDGVVRLQVIESRIGRVRVVGNRYFTMEKILEGLPSLTPGRILYLPSVQREIARLNRNQDFKVNPVMSPGAEFGTIDVELDVEDKLPLHGYLELNNRATYDTTALRLNAMVRYDNLWQRENSLAVQYQMSPLDPSQVEMLGASYVLPTPWEEDHQLAIFGIWSDSNSAFGDGFRVIGKGWIIGMRYVIPLEPYRLYTHNITLGLDYKNFNQNVGSSAETTETPITYLPLSFSYSASLPDEGGVTQFSAGLNLSFRGLVAHEDEFEVERFEGVANYAYATWGIQRSQKLPWGMTLFMKVDGQVASDPLPQNEQYYAGGMVSVRGYWENEAVGDDAVHGTVEVSFPDPLERLGIDKGTKKGFQLTPFVFYDGAKVSVADPLPGQDSSMVLGGVGAGMRGSLTTKLEYELDWGVALNTSSHTQKYDQKVYFSVRGLL